MEFEQGDSGMSAGYKRWVSFRSLRDPALMLLASALGSTTSTTPATRTLSNSLTLQRTTLLLSRSLARGPTLAPASSEYVPHFLLPFFAKLVSQMPTITNFVQTSDNVLQTLMNALEASLDLPDGTFASRHLEKDLSGSEARTIFKPAAGAQGYLAEGTGADGKPAAAIGCA